MAEFVEHVHVESDTMLQRLEARPPVVRPDDVASILRNFRARAAALLRRVSCRSAADVVQTSGRRPSPPLPRRSSVDRSGPSSSRRGYEAAHTSHGRPYLSAHPSTGVHQGVSRIRGTHVEHGTTTSAGIPNSALCSPLAGSIWVGTLPLHANGGQRVEHTSMGTSYHSACARAGPHTAHIR
nr:uncharacterized protein LOC112938809 [Oryza sativa Japonica Group]